MSAPNIAPEVVQKLVDLAHRAKSMDRFNCEYIATIAAAIVAELPEPVDPDLLEASALYKEWSAGSLCVEDFLLIALKRGRELERGQ